jgi:hypothetical protein
MNQSYIIQLLQRLASESPAFSKWLQRIAFVVGIITATFAFMMKYQLIDFPKMDNVRDALFGLSTFFGGLFVGAKTSTTNPTLIDDKTKENVFKDGFNS